jgi:hypothetical protein
VRTSPTRMEQPIDALAERSAVAADGDTVTLAEK